MVSKKRWQKGLGHFVNILFQHAGMCHHLQSLLRFWLKLFQEHVQQDTVLAVSWFGGLLPLDGFVDCEFAASLSRSSLVSFTTAPRSPRMSEA